MRDKPSSMLDKLNKVRSVNRTTLHLQRKERKELVAQEPVPSQMQNNRPGKSKLNFYKILKIMSKLFMF